MRGRGEFILSIYMRTIIYADDSPVDPRRRSSPTDLAWKTYRGSGPTTTSRRRPCSPWCASIVTPANASSRSCAGDWCPTVQSRRRSATPRSTPGPRRRRPSRCFAKRSIGADASFRQTLFTSGSGSTRRQRGRLPSPCKAASPTHLPASGSAGIRRSVARDLHHLTTDPHGLAERVPDRMPVILDPQDQSRWMGPADSGDPARPAVDLLRPYPAEQMRS